MIFHYQINAERRCHILCELRTTGNQVYLLHISRLFLVVFPYQKEKESTRLLREAFEERMRTEHPFTAKQLKRFNNLKALLARVPKLSKADRLKAEEAAKKETCTAKLKKQEQQSEEKRHHSLQPRNKGEKSALNSYSFDETAPASLTLNSLTPLPPSPSWLRLDLPDPPSSFVPKTSSTQLPHHIWVITRTTLEPKIVIKVLCLCTKLPVAKTVMTHLADELALRSAANLPEDAETVLLTSCVMQKYARKDDAEFGFDVFAGDKFSVDIKARWEEGAVWQGMVGREKVFGEGFDEITVESVRTVMDG